MSTDRGESWTSILSNLTQYLAVDPFNSSTLYAITVGSFKRSLDAGVTWQSFTDGLPASSQVVIATDPQVAGTLYTIAGSAIYKRTLTGQWVIRNTGLPASGFPAFITIDPNNPSTLYTGGGIGLFKSIDGGANWAPFATTAGRQAILLAFDPSASGRVYNSSSDAVERSNDGGKT